MVNYISGLVFVVLLLVGTAVVAPFAEAYPVIATIVGTVWLVSDSIVASAIKLAAQWQRAVVFRLGKFKQIKGPGLFLIIPLIDQVRMVDTRVLAVNIPKQQVITRDNVPVVIDGVLFFRVTNAADAIIMVQDYRYMIAQYAQTSLRDVIGQMTLDQLLVEREQIARAIEVHVEKDTKGWGLEVTAFGRWKRRRAQRLAGRRRRCSTFTGMTKRSPRMVTSSSCTAPSSESRRR